MRMLGLVVMKPAGQSAHLNESAVGGFAITIAVEESKCVPGKQQKDKPRLPQKSVLVILLDHISLHQV